MSKPDYRHHRVRLAAGWCLMLWAALVLTGCGAPTMFTGPGGKLKISSRVNPDLKAKTGFDEGYYSLDDRNQITIVLIDGTIEDPMAAMTVRMLWRPMFARTPIEATATNATVHYVVFREPGESIVEPTATTAPEAGAGSEGESDDTIAPDADAGATLPPVIDPNRGQVAIYSGAGFLYPYAKPGKKKLRVGMWEASVRMHDSTTGFDDQLGAAEIKGRFTVRRDDQAIHSLLHRLSVQIRERLGYPRLVRSE